MKKQFGLIFTFLLLTIFIGCTSTVNNESNEATVYDKVIESGEITVGYVPYPPGLIKDPNTGEFSGIFYDVLQEIGNNLELEINYTEEVTWATLVESVKSGRVDIIGSPVWPTSQRGKFAEFSEPLYFGGLVAYVRADDERFDNNLERINSPETEIAVIDGEISSIVANYDFPEAQISSLPQSTDIPQLLLEITNNKADITFVEPYVANGFLVENPGELKQVEGIPPLRVYPNTMMVKKGEFEFISMINVALEELINSGVVEKIINKYEPFENAFLRNQYPYR